MRVTSILTLGSWISKIHPPLPRSARESQQLLNVLTSSFQQHLDELHPPIERRGRQAKQSSQNTSESAIQRIDTLVKSPDSIDGFSTVPVSNDRTITEPKTTQLVTSIQRGAHDLESLLLYLRSVATSPATNKKTHSSGFEIRQTSEMVARWFENADAASRNSICKSRAFLETIKWSIPFEDLSRIVWSNLDRSILESPSEVTYEEASALSGCSHLMIILTPRQFMPATADRFSRLINLFLGRGYKLRHSGQSSNEDPIPAFHPLFHPLKSPARTLATYILRFPESHNLRSEHFDALLSVGDIWKESSSLWGDLVRALHPTKSNPDGVVRALRDPDFRSTYSESLKHVVTGQLMTSLRSVCGVLKQLGRFDEAEDIAAFIETHHNGGDVKKVGKQHPTRTSSADGSILHHRPIAWTEHILLA